MKVRELIARLQQFSADEQELDVMVDLGHGVMGTIDVACLYLRWPDDVVGLMYQLPQERKDQPV